MKTVPTWRVILGSIVLTTAIVASYSLRHDAVETAEAAPAHRDAGAGSAGSAHGDAGTPAGSAAGSAAGSGATKSKAKRHSTDNAGPPSDDTPQVPPVTTPLPPGAPGKTGPLTPGTTPVPTPTTPGTAPTTPTPPNTP